MNELLASQMHVGQKILVTLDGEDVSDRCFYILGGEEGVSCYGAVGLYKEPKTYNREIDDLEREFKFGIVNWRHNIGKIYLLATGYGDAYTIKKGFFSKFEAELYMENYPEPDYDLTEIDIEYNDN